MRWRRLAVKRYRKGAEARLSGNFRLGEFHCKGKNCCSATLVEEKLVSLLQKLREKLGRPVNINSAYRCVKHNAAVGGVAGSNHLKGKAADIIVPGVDAAEVAKAAESVGFKGIILYTKRKFVHVAVRDTKSFQKNTGSRTINVQTFGGSEPCPYEEPKTAVRRGDRNEGVRWVQWMLGKCGYKLSVDGSFGPETTAAVRAFQANHGLLADGIAGPETRAKLKAVV